MNASDWESKAGDQDTIDSLVSEEARAAVQKYHVDKWFDSVKTEFSGYTRSFSGTPFVYVEIGNWMGASLSYIAENVATHPGSIMIGVDPYVAMMPKHPQSHMDARHDFATKRVRNVLKPYQGAFFHYRQPSRDFLCNPPLIVRARGIDLLYIDGDHAAHACLTDFVIAWQWLNDGATVIFDDYGIGLRKPDERTVPTAIQAIRECWPAGSLEFNYPFGRQVALIVHKK